jgi:pimeloyl-ACP methyl ester carboxylesterase
MHPSLIESKRRTLVARVLFLHGSAASPFSDKASFLERHGHEVVGRPRLPYPRHPRCSWRWLLTYCDRAWFREAVQAAGEAFNACRPDIVVGSSMGGAVAMNLAAGDTPQVLIAPAWRAWYLLRCGKARRVRAATVIIQGDRDRTVFPRYSRRLLANSRASNADASGIASLEKQLAERFGREPAHYRVQGRLVLVRGEGHRCNSDHAMNALRVGVETLTQAAEGTTKLRCQHELRSVSGQHDGGR